VVAGGDFFSDPMWASLAKIAILRKYLRPFTYKLGSRPPGRVWLVDGFAGAGCYEPDVTGNTKDGSPRAAAKLARELELDRSEPLLRTINVEADFATYLKLLATLAPYKHLCANINKTFENALEEILATIRNDPALFFLDPFGVNGIEMHVLERIRARAGKTELLIHFSDRSVLRMAGSLDDNEQRKEVGQKASDAKVAKLDEVIGSTWWQRIWSNKQLTTDQRIDGIAKLYASELRARGFNYAHEIRMRDDYTDRPKYRLVFCTRSPHGVELMSYFACEYERELFDRHYEGSLDIYWIEQEREDARAALRDEIHALGVLKGTMTTRAIVHALTPLHFGDFLGSEYSAAIRELVDVGGIDRKSRKGIKETETLKFVSMPQQSLFGTRS
jgi:three-Cys-motif partner protein